MAHDALDPVWNLSLASVPTVEQSTLPPRPQDPKTQSYAKEFFVPQSLCGNVHAYREINFRAVRYVRASLNPSWEATKPSF